ncbi:MAG: helix-turn-helix domain-containing protein [Lachnospiraceae bacterium]
MGKEIHRLRNSRGITQEALAEALNVTAQTVSKWERGTSMPDVQMLPEIAVYFGVTIDQLFAMDPDKQMERIENQIYSKGLMDAAEVRQMEQQLHSFAENPQHKGQAELVLAKLYNHQAEQYHLLAVKYGKEAVEMTGGDRDAISELANAWGSYMSDWNLRNHHDLIEWFKAYCHRNPDNRAALMWLLDNLIDDRRLEEADQYLGKLERMDHTYRTPMYRFMIAQAAGEREEAESWLHKLETMENQDWSWAVTLGEIYTQQQEYAKAIDWFRKGQDMQPSPKYTDSAESIAHICQIQGDKAGAIAAYREELRLLREDWGIISGETYEAVERNIQKLQS